MVGGSHLLLRHSFYFMLCMSYRVVEGCKVGNVVECSGYLRW